MNAMTVLKDAWQNRHTLGDSQQSQQLAAFLPAALEIQETPPNPLMRWLAWSLLALVLIAILWASFGQVNIVASAEGKIIPSSRVKQIQPLAKSVVKAILVKEGQYVQQGDPLIELDNTLTRADQTRLSAELDTLQRNLTVSQSLLDLLSKPVAEQQTITYSQLTLPNSGEENTLYKQLLWQQREG